jgi:hypothetical protein
MTGKLDLQAGVEVDDESHDDGRQQIGQRELFIAQAVEKAGVAERLDDVVRRGDQEKITEKKQGNRPLGGLDIDDAGGNRTEEAAGNGMTQAKIAPSKSIPKKSFSGPLPRPRKSPGPWSAW